MQSPCDLESRFNVEKYGRREKINNTAAQIMKRLSKQYKDVYFLSVENVLGKDGTIDNSHPTDLGFYRFVKAYQPKIAKILRKYRIK